MIGDKIPATFDKTTVWAEQFEQRVMDLISEVEAAGFAMTINVTTRRNLVATDDGYSESVDGSSLSANIGMHGVPFIIGSIIGSELAENPGVIANPTEYISKCVHVAMHTQDAVRQIVAGEATFTDHVTKVFGDESGQVKIH